jgi:hypothetical protein
MNKQNIRRMQRGQGLPEYSLTLVLVALASIIALVLLGFAVQRLYAIVGGVSGASRNASANGNYIIIDQADCYIVGPNNPHYATYDNGNPPPWYSTGLTAIYVNGTTNVPLPDLQASTNRGFATDITENNHAAGTFVYNPIIIDQHPDPGLCPAAVVIQSTKYNLTALRPMKKVVDN